MMEGNMNIIDDITLFSQQEIDSMDFSNIMDVDDSDASLFTAEGIEAETLNSLLEQFEATESTDSMLESLIETRIDLDMKEYNYDLDNLQNISGTSSPVLTTDVLDKIRSKNTNKRTAIMLPIGTPTTKKDKALSDGSSKLQRLLKKKSGDKDDGNLEKFDPLSDTNIQDIQSDHDYCYNSSNDNPDTPTKPEKTTEVSSPVIPAINFEMSAKQTSRIYETLSSKSKPMENSVDKLNLSGTDLNNSMGEISTSSDSVEMSTSQGSRDSGVEEGEILDIDGLMPAKESVFFPCPRNLKSKRSYRKHEEPIISDESKYYDKIPAYFTTLSLPQKPPKREVTTGGISVADYIPRDRSPTRDSDSMYSKLPDYYSCFTNSTKYDEQEGNEIEIKLEPVEEIDKNGRTSRRSSRSRSSSSSSSSSCGSSCSSCSRSSSRGRSFDRFKRSERRKRRNSYSSTSLSSSRSRSRSSSSYSSSYSHNGSRSRSRSYSGDRKRSKRTIPRRYRSRQKSRSISRSRPSYRSRSRRRSRHRSRRSYSRSPSRSRSIERRTERKKCKEEEKQRQIKERRIVYVGRIPTEFTKNDLRKRFDRFGEITNVSTHFREYGDNYGFVTFAYTCDAFAAIEKGNAVPGEMKFDLCFGGRRQFCDTEYADLDGKNDEEEDMFEPIVKPKAPVSDFDELLRQAQQKIKR